MSGAASTPSHGRIEARIAELGLTLPPPPKPVAAYVPAVRSGGHVFLAGQIPTIDGKPLFLGRVGVEVSIDDAIECAKRCALNGLAALKGEIGDLDRVVRVVRLGVFVACDHAFTQHPKVANGASEMMVAIFGEAGKHARAAVGAPSLPLGVPVEIDFIFEVK
ncbi:MAG: RidA family protein [Planctomycetota bacterium]|nr:RidA family protein [Planctomycetota bacterium]